MTGIVYYMVITDRSDAPGLIFPSETEYSDFRTGQWFIVANSGLILEMYNFDTVQNGELITYSLKRLRNNIYQVITKDGQKYYFRIEPRRYWSNKYVGNSSLIASDDTLFVVQPIDPFSLSIAAKEKKFYFIGSVDNQINKNLNK